MAAPVLGRVDVVSFPVPGFENRLLRVLRDPGAAGYDVLPEGTPLEDCEFIRGADLEKFETGFFLCKVVPQPNSGLVEWYFLNERSNEDDYNFETAYEGEDQDYPIVTRSYIMLRSRYEALTFSDTDPRDSRLTLAAQKQARAEDPIVDSLFVAVQRVFQRIPGKELSGKVITQEGQVGTLTRQVVTPGTTLVPSATTISGSVQPETGGRSVLEKVEVDEVFDEKRVAKEKPDLVPQEFRGAVPTETTEVTEPGLDVAMPSLAPGDLAKSEQRLSEHKVRKTSVSRPSTALPATLTDTLVDNEGVLVSRNKTLASNPQTITPSATVSGQVENLGDGLTLKTEDTKAEVFPGKVFASEAPDPAPAKFRVAVPAVTTEETIAGQAAAPTLDTGDLAKSEQQLTKFTKRTRKTSRAPGSLPKALTQTATTNELQKAVVTETLQTGDTSEQPSATTTIESEALGDGNYIVRKTEVPEVFPGKVFAIEKPDNVPVEFRAEKPAEVEEITEEGQAAPVTLANDEISKSEQQLTKFTKRVRKTKRDLTTSAVLEGEQIDQDGVKVTVRRTLAQGSQSVAPSATVSGQVDDIGDGKTIKTELTKAEVFPAKTFAVEKPDPAPPKFRVEIPAQTEEITETGDAVPVTLTSDEIAKSEQQLTKFTKRTRKTTRDAAPNASLSGKKTGVWGEESVEETYDENENITPGYKTLSARKEPLGGGKFLGEKIVVGDPQTLVEARIDADTGIALTIEKSLVAANQGLPSKPTNGGVERVPIDAWNSVQIVTRVDNLPAPETFETTMNVAYPDELLEVGVLWESSTSGAAGSAGAISLADIVRDKIPWSSSAEASSAIQVVGSVYVKVKNGHRGPVRASVTRTYLTAPPTNTYSFKVWRPVNGAVVIKGRGLSLTARSSVAGQGAAQTNRSSAQRASMDTFARSIPFGPVLHSGIALTNPNPPPLQGPTYSASGGSVPGGGGYPAATAQATAQASAQLELPPSDAPPGAGFFHIELVRTEKWRFGIWVQEVYTVYHP